MFGNHRFGPTVTALVVRHSHRILDDRIEKSIKEDKLDNAHLPQVYLRCKDCIRLFRSGVKEEGGWLGAGKIARNVLWDLFWGGDEEEGG